MKDDRYQEALQAIGRGEYQAARTLLHVCLDQSSHEPADVYFLMGWCLECDTSGDKAQAREHYRMSLEAGGDPGRRLEAHFRLGWLFIQESRWSDALVQLRNAVNCAGAADSRSRTVGHAVFWEAVALETQGYYMDAVAGYRRAGSLEPVLGPEGVLREIACLNQIGRYEEALRACRSMSVTVPNGFDPCRFDEILMLVRKEQAALESCLSEA